MRLATKTAAIGGGVAGVLGIVAGVVTAVPQAADAAPNFQMPFTCGYTATAATFAGHNPPNSVDFQKAGITGDTVVAAAAGTVTRSEATPAGTSYGNWIEINHGGGWRTRYAHLSVRSVKVGQKVGLGTKIGNAGATGDATGPHVHFEENHNGVTQKAVLNGVHVPYYGHTSFTSHNKCGGGGGNPYTPSAACGSGYSVIDHHALGKAGTVYLAYKPSTGQNCVVTMKATGLSKRTKASAHLQARGGAKHTDSGSYRYYAGPVRVKAAKTCVQWGGSLGSTGWTSKYGHCG